MKTRYTLCLLAGTVLPLHPLIAQNFLGNEDAAPQLAKPALPYPPDIVVTASRADLLGVASTASQGSISGQEVALRPIYRPSQLFESIPGLVVSIHSGEGKAQRAARVMLTRSSRRLGQPD
ncbi:MAG: hypothetical protein ACRYG4_25980 [Janthinobacterium lividum]